jgi:hypothetical protein
MSKKLPEWMIQGELILNCNCTVFCPCVISLGSHYPTEGHCHAWLGVRIEKGSYGGEQLDELNVAMILDIPGRMSDGDWKVGTYIDNNATEAAFEGLSNIFAGRAGGTTRLFTMLVSEFIGVSRAKIEYTNEGKNRGLVVDKHIIGEIHPIEGNDSANDVTLQNTSYWMGPDITIAQASKGKVRAFGRVWNFEGKSAEICQIKWSGP